MKSKVYCKKTRKALLMRFVIADQPEKPNPSFLGAPKVVPKSPKDELTKT
jgi:hypothetical protein